MFRIFVAGSGVRRVAQAAKPGGGIGTDAVNTYFKMEMGTGGDTGVPHITDGVTLADALAQGDGNAGHVAVKGVIAVSVVDHDAAAVAALYAGAGDGAGVRSYNRRSVGRADIQSRVGGLINAGYRVIAWAEFAGGIGA